MFSPLLRCICSFPGNVLETGKRWFKMVKTKKTSYSDNHSCQSDFLDLLFEKRENFKFSYEDMKYLANSGHACF